MSPSPVSEFLMVPVANIDSICDVMSLARVHALDTIPRHQHIDIVSFISSTSTALFSSQYYMSKMTKSCTEYHWSLFLDSLYMHKSIKAH